jgi:DNA-directed RNA polymerase beta subunit
VFRLEEVTAMASKVQSNFRHRTNLGRVEPIEEIPNLIDIQKSSYDKFLQSELQPRERREIGLEAVFRSVFPIKDFDGTSELVYVSYNLEKPKYDVDECRQRGMTFAAPIKVTIQLIIYDVPQDGGERIVRDIKEQEVYFGEIPLMTETGTFIINGTSASSSRSCTVAPACSSTTTRARRTRAGNCSSPRASSRTRARGSTSSSTTRTSSTCASIGAARCTPRCCSARSATARRSS